MISIKLNNIDVKSASNKSGVFIGNNFDPNWKTFEKSNTNVSGNKVSNSLNFIIDEDGYDFTVSNHDIVVTEDMKENKKSPGKPSYTFKKKRTTNPKKKYQKTKSTNRCRKK